jgi:NhaA family Na+:H+ antiporter
MSAFFMLLSIELKQSLVSKNKMDKNLISMPSIAAFGGIFLSTVIYLLINHNNAAAQHGFGIVTTTDTAVVLCILTALGNRIPKNLRLFMLLLSAIDDILAIFIIAIFYTSSLSLVSILLALSGVCVLFILNRFRVFKLTPYLLVGVFIWFCVLQSGIHATLAGAIIGLCIPLSKNKKQTNLILLKKNLKYLRPLQISG